ncbi:MAG: zinc ribbon domain-containing protein [Lentilitoribacter sp.]
MQDYCQSCSLPMAEDPNHGGSEKDGSHNETYCSYCYADGAFISPEMTVQDMQALCMIKVQERGVPKPLAWLMTRTMPKLKRWREQKENLRS